MVLLMALKFKALIGLALLAAGVGIGRVKNAKKLAAIKAFDVKATTYVVSSVKAAETAVVNEVKKL